MSNEVAALVAVAVISAISLVGGLVLVMSARTLQRVQLLIDPTPRGPITA